MARRLSMLLGFIFLITLTARAQDQVEIFGGYTFERYGGTPERNLNGWEIEGKYKVAPWFGLAADLDGHYGLPSQPDARTLHFMVGPQITFPGRFSPYLHVLGGVGHHQGDGAQTSFAGAVGGGVDLRLAPLVSWRMVQADDVMTRFSGTTQHSMRLSTGLVIRF